MEMYNKTLRPIPHSGHKQPAVGNSKSPSQSKRVSRTHVPSFTTSSVFLLSSLFDGLKVLDPHQSCNRRASHHRDAFIRLGRRRWVISRVQRARAHQHTCDVERKPSLLDWTVYEGELPNRENELYRCGSSEPRWVGLLMR
jgi:hypothetical protein